MKRTVRMERLTTALFAVFCAIGSVLGLRAETYYWTGAVDATTGNKGNWSLTSGGAAASRAPGQGDTVIFENTEAITLTKSAALKYLAYEFRGASVSLPKGNNFRQYGYGGGGITVTGTGTYTFGYPLELNAGQFAGEDKTFVVDVAEGASVIISDSGTTKIYSPAHFIKRGAGTFKCTQFIETIGSGTTRGDLTFEAGTLTTERPTDRNNCFGGFAVTGTAAKQFTQDAMNLHIERYSETVDASQTLTFNNSAGSGYRVELTGACDVPRFSAVVTASYNADNTLCWNPAGDDYTMTMVDRVWDTSRGHIQVARGTMRFADGAGVKYVAGFTVKSGATLEIAASASGNFSGASLVLEDGAKLKVDGSCHYFKPAGISYNGTAVADGVYSAQDLTWLDGDGYLLVGAAARPALTLYWTGEANEASPKLATAGNWRCEDGSAVPSLVADDSLVVSNETDLVVADSCTIGANRTFTKRGAGSFLCVKYLPSDASPRGRLVFEAGILTSQRDTDTTKRLNGIGEFVVAGPAAKRVTMDAMNYSIDKYVEQADASQALTFYNYVGTGYTVELSGACDVPRFSADVLGSDYGDCTLKWNPGADKTITMVDRVWNSSKAKFDVASGTMRFADGAGVKKLQSFTVATGAKVEIAASAGLFSAPTVLTLESGAKLKIDGDVTLPAVTYAGVAVSDGVYRVSSVEWLEGDADALLVVGSGSPAETVAASWTGNGDGTTITDPANWGAAGSTVLPDFTSGTLVATFPANGTVTIPSGSTWNFKGIVVDPNGTKGDTLKIQGAGTMWVGSAGLVSVGAGAVTIGVKTGILSSNPWSYGATAGDGSLTFAAAAEVFTIGSAVWTVNTTMKSYGASDSGPFLKIFCSNPNLKDSRFKMPVQAAADGALGGSDSVSTVDCSAKANLALEFIDCHLYNRQIALENVNNVNYLRSLRATGAVTLDGELYFDAQNDYYWYSTFPRDGHDKFVVKGGWKTLETTNQSNASRPYADGYNVHVESVLTANKLALDKWGYFYLYESDNVIPRGVFVGAGADLHIAKANAFKPGTSTSTVAGIGFTGAGTLDLETYDQTLQILAGTGAGIVTSTVPVTLTLNANVEYVTSAPRGWEGLPTFSTKYGSGTSAPDGELDIKDAQQTDFASFVVGVSLVKTGALPHWIGGLSTSTGTVTVTEGTLAFKDGARWRGAPSVTVSGTGVLAAEGDKPFSTKTDLFVTGETADRIRIAAGKKVVIRSLTVNGVRQSSVPSGMVTGGGTLQIGPDGLCVIVR